MMQWSRLFLVFLPLAASGLHYETVEVLSLPDTASAIVDDHTRHCPLATGGRDGREYLREISSNTDDGWAPANIPRARYAALARARGAFYATHRQTGKLWRFADDGTAASLHLGLLPGQMALSPDAGTLVALTGCDWHPGQLDTGSALRIVALDTFTEAAVRTCPLPEGQFGEARAVCVNKAGTTAFVAAAKSDYGAVTVLAIDLAAGRVSHQHTIRQDSVWVSPHGLVLTAADEPVLAIDGRAESRLVLLTRELVPQRSLVLGRGPTVLARAPDGTHALVASRGESSLRVLYLPAFGLGPPWPSPVECPALLAFGQTGDRVYVAGSYGDRLAVAERKPGRPPSPLSPEPAPPLEERILYVASNGRRSDLRAMRPDGTDDRAILQLPPGTTLAKLSPDGGQVAYLEEGNAERNLFVQALATGAKRQLTDAASDRRAGRRRVIAADSLEWLPHGRAIVYCTPHDMYESEFFVISAQGGASYPLLNNYEDRDLQPSPHPWDPDRLLFLFDPGNWTFDREFRLLDRASGQQWTVFPRNGHTHDRALWYPDGKHLVWTQSGSELRSPTTISTMRIDGTHATELFPARPDRRGRACVAFSPDSSRILCTLFHDTHSSLVVLDLRAGTSTPLPTTGGKVVGTAWARIPLPSRVPDR